MHVFDTSQQQAILDQLRIIIADIPGCLMPYDMISSSHYLREDLGLDSLAMVDLMVVVEDSFNVYFDPVKMDLDTAFETVGSLATILIELEADTVRDS